MKKWDYQCTSCDKIYENLNDDGAKHCKELKHEFLEIPTKEYGKKINKEIGSKKNQSFVKTKKNMQITSTILDHKIQTLRPQTFLNDENWKMILVYLPTKNTVVKGEGESQETSYEYLNSAYFVISKPKTMMFDERIILPIDHSYLAEKFRIKVLQEWNDVRWDENDSQKWLMERDKSTPLDLYELVDGTARDYLEYDEVEYIKFNLWNIATYFFELFDAFPYNDFTGTKRAGKSKSLEFQKLVCFNAIMSPDATSSSIFRIIEGIGATILLDETENFKNKKDDQAQAVRNILLQGFLKDQTALRNETSKEKNFTPTQYNLYSPKSLAHINAFDDVLEDRCISQINKRALNEKIRNSWCTNKDSRFQIIRNKCYRLFLDYADEVVDLQEEARTHLLVSGREMQLWLPIMTFAVFFEKHGCRELVSKIIENISTSSETRQLIDEQESRDLRVLNYLSDCGVSNAENDLRLKNNPKGWIPISELFNGFKEKFEDYDIHPDYFTRNVLTETLKKLGFHQGRKQGGISWLITRYEVDQVKKRMGYFETIDGSKNTSEGSDTAKSPDSGTKNSAHIKNQKFRKYLESSDVQKTLLTKSEESEENEQTEQEIDTTQLMPKSEQSEPSEISESSDDFRSSESISNHTHWECLTCGTGIREIDETSISSGNILKVHEKSGRCKIKYFTKSEAEEIESNLS